MIKYSKMEFGIVTAILIFFLFVSYTVSQQNYAEAVDRNVTAGHGPLTFAFAFMQAVTVTYGAFIAFNFYIVPKLLFQKKYVETLGLTICIVSIISLCYSVFLSYQGNWDYGHTEDEVNKILLVDGFAMGAMAAAIYAGYVVIREFIAHQYKSLHIKQNLQMRIIREVVFVYSIWLILLIPVLILRNTGLLRSIAPMYCFGLPCCFALYFLNLHWLIPLYKRQLLANGIVYALCLAAIACMFGFAEAFMFAQIRHHYFARMMMMYWLVPSLVTIAVSWWVFLTSEDTYRQLTTLKTALGTSNANLQYLRSQINPHFLFNTLNTLYGTALMEKADKTGEGIQKLGDMMRFMLHENNQDRIALSRELDYLHNYIDLQNMRLALSPHLTIEVQIEDILEYYEIAPMLLIPFIENAYKHGISLQERSWIVVSLYKTGDILHLDVHNSIHQVSVNDPERFHSGTGLDNVKQRLQLLYPQKHELVVRQNIKEFFIHLTITLNTQTIL